MQEARRRSAREPGMLGCWSACLGGCNRGPAAASEKPQRAQASACMPLLQAHLAAALPSRPCPPHSLCAARCSADVAAPPSRVRTEGSAPDSSSRRTIAGAAAATALWEGGAAGAEKDAARSAAAIDLNLLQARVRGAVPRRPLLPLLLCRPLFLPASLWAAPPCTRTCAAPSHRRTPRSHTLPGLQGRRATLHVCVSAQKGHALKEEKPPTDK